VSWSELRELVTWRDLLDVGVVAILFYNLLLLIRGTRAVQMLSGLLFAAVLFFVARTTGLVTLETIIEKVLIFLPFAIIVLFQQEIRRALARFGRNPLMPRTAVSRVDEVVEEIALAASAMSSRKIGALVVVARGEGLRNYTENGVAIDARVSFDLLVNVFAPGTPLHDGAVIVEGDRIVAAACYLPLSSSVELSTSYGTRHRAAVGISEETDALAVVVSEETGRVSLAVGGNLLRDLDGTQLREELRDRLRPEVRRHGWRAPW
jgi:uncharacterized protein (TIGR00159 family)